MRSLVGIITIIATVIHFTFGCCLHPCHFGGCDATPGARAAAEVVEACGTCCHDHEAVKSEERCCVPAEGGGLAAVVPGRCLDCDGCQGCHCAATSTEMVTVFPWSPFESGIVAALDGDAIATFASASAVGNGPPDPDVHADPGRTPLFDRFLI